MDIRKLKGFKDILPAEIPVWEFIERTAHRVFARYGFEQVRLPMLEDTALFLRGIGEATDIVEKEMYTFTDTGGASVTLRPEGTASAVRAYVENGMHRSAPRVRLYYSGPMFRRERPQKGRLRQFHQLGAECFGWGEPEADADVITLLWDLFDALGLGARVNLEINSLGCADDRSRYVATLRDTLAPRREQLCDNCRRRLDTNPLRVLDCKSPRCREVTADVPAIAEGLCDDCATHFDGVRKVLDAQEVPYEVNPRMVRGLDYYNRTTFELLSGDLGAQSAVAAGGRYDGLSETLGGPPVEALGFAVGVERMAMLLEGRVEPPPGPTGYLIHRGCEALQTALVLRRELARKGIDADLDYQARSFKAQMRSANRKGARYALILGEDELAAGTVTVKDLAEGTQIRVPRTEVANALGGCGTPPTGLAPTHTSNP